VSRIINLQAAGPLKLSRYSKRVYRLGLYAYAHEFYEIARKTRRSPVKAYLLGHALELFLKSFLMAKGIGIRELKEEYGHNLSNLLSESMKDHLGDDFRISPQLKTDFDDFSRSYIRKDYEYFPFFGWLFGQPLPDTKRLFRFAGQLDKRLPPIIDKL
jgi:hypothetical protein